MADGLSAVLDGLLPPFTLFPSVTFCFLAAGFILSLIVFRKCVVATDSVAALSVGGAALPLPTSARI